MNAPPARPPPWVARYDGDEFLPETNVVNAGKAAEHLRELIASSNCVVNDQEYSITASFGVAGWKGNAPLSTSLDVLVGRCDAGVYASKAAGRNAVTVEVMDSAD